MFLRFVCPKYLFKNIQDLNDVINRMWRSTSFDVLTKMHCLARFRMLISQPRPLQVQSFFAFGGNTNTPATCRAN